MQMGDFADRDGTIWFDGRLVPWREAQTHVMNQGLHYGATVFEGERTYGGRIFRLTEHTERLIASARAMGYELPYSCGEIELATMQAIKASGLRDGYVRPFAWPGSRYMDLLIRDNEIHLAIAVWGVRAGPDESTRRRGLRLQLSEGRRPDDATLPGAAKSAASWAIGGVVREAAVRAGFDDAIMLNPQGNLAGTTGANLFLGIDGALHTPLPKGYIDGITRRTVIDLMKRRGIEVIERDIAPGEIDSIREAFITGTAAEVTPVTRIGNRSLSIGTFTRKATADYHDLVRSEGELIN
ncbi:aminotransferase class IV [Salipiger mucosus]|uniref:Probable branched-chain-amino-acid aminotransferase n=1 Tax=Salipiger mucosus DSM 16094 TaxID=1123237 RepID=S9QZV5_9RHOB|nr:aminotransferase class IV [Salipiger mucosus]EPX85218.1 Branched-chain amino acid aminotransferase [Salipiger mucosus DSM 16094]